MRIWATVGVVAIGAVGSYETWDYSRMNPFHQRTYAEEMIDRGAAPTQTFMDDIIKRTSEKEYCATIQTESTRETLRYNPERGITLLIEQEGAVPITYVDRNADGFAEQHMMGTSSNASALPSPYSHYCAPNTVPDIMFLDHNVRNPQAKEAEHGYAAQKEYAKELKIFATSSMREIECGR